MKLTREEIDGVTFTCIRRRYYLAVEVDRCLDELAAEAEKNTLLIRELQSKIEELQELVKTSSKVESEEIITQANERAQAIIRRGERKSNELITNATVQKNRVTAASRAAYYNALQFKQDLAKQFRHMEEELDASLDILSRVENTQPVSALPGDADGTGEAAADKPAQAGAAPGEKTQAESKA